MYLLRLDVRPLFLSLGLLSSAAIFMFLLLTPKRIEVLLSIITLSVQSAMYLTVLLCIAVCRLWLE